MLHPVCGACAVLRTGCRDQCFAHAAGCALPAARRTRNAAVPCVSCGISHVLASSCMSSAVCCTVSVGCVACWLLSFARCLLSAACCLVACCLVVCCPLHAVCCLFHVVCGLLHAAYCMLPCALHVVVIRCVLPACIAHVVWLLCVACGVSSVAFSPSHVPRRMLSGLHFPVVSCTLSLACRPWHAVRWTVLAARCLLSAARCLWSAVYRLLHVVCCLWSVFCCPPECPMSHGVRCLSPVPRRISSRCMCCVASRLLHSARPLFVMLSLVRCVSHLACRPLPVAPLTRSAVAHAAHPCARTATRRVTPSRLLPARTHTSVCSRSRRPLRRSTASAAAGIRAPEASRRKAETAAACLRS